MSVRTTEPRGRGERYKLRVQVGILSEDGQALGSVHDISVTGARIEGAPVVPPEGTELRLGFSFYAYALPVPIRGQVVRHTETGGFAVDFKEVDFRTQILLQALLPKFSREQEVLDVAPPPNPPLELELPPELLGACCKLAEAESVPLHQWVLEQLERIAFDDA